MKINKISMAIIAAAAVMAISPAVMAQATNQAAGGGAGAGGRGGFGGRTNALTVETLNKTLTLTDAEKPKVKSAVEEYNKAMTEARQADQSDRRTKMMAARTDLNKKMKEILTPEQYTKYEATSGRGGRNGGRNRGGAGGGAGGAGGAGGGN